MRSILCVVFAMATMLPAGCDTLNDAVPPISVSGGVFGLNGTSGKEMHGVFLPALKAAALAATAHFTLTETFDDADAGDFAELEELVTHLGVAVETGNVGMKLVNTGGGSYPASITATYWTLDFTISDPSSSIVPPRDLNAAATVTFTRSGSCSGLECPYTVTAGAVEQLANLFPIEITQPDYLDDLSDVVFMTDGEPNSPNTLFLQLYVEVSNPAADFAGLEALIRVGEYETQITPVIF